MTVKNAITDQFIDKNLPRPNVCLDDPDLSILVYLQRDVATVYRVWSGDKSMHKRGYRQDEVIHKAALRESTAAALYIYHIGYF